MITVRVNSTSSGSGYPRNVYNARHERMGDAMGLNDAREVPEKLRKHNRRKEIERSENNFKLGAGGEGRESDVRPGSVSRFCGNEKIQKLRQGRGTHSAVGIRRGGNIIG